MLLSDEDGHEEMLRLWRGAERVIASDFLFIESAAALAKARRMRRFTSTKERELRIRLDRLWPQIRSVPVEGWIIRSAAEFSSRHDLTAPNAVHLASAYAGRDAIDAFVASDKKLLTAARKAGFATAEV